MDGLVIRAAVDSDKRAVEKIAKECWAPIYEGYKAQLGDEIYGLVYSVDPLQVKAEKVSSAVSEGRVLVAELEGVVCGFATFLYESENVGSLKDNAVSPDFKGRGIAAKLYEAVFEKLRGFGCRVVRVGTGLDDAHAPARHAYEKAGFEKELSNVTYFKKL